MQLVEIEVFQIQGIHSKVYKAVVDYKIESWHLAQESVYMYF